MITLQNVSKTYWLDQKKIEALNQVTITIESGDIYGIIGYSGAGKSTLLRCINLLERPDEGVVTIKDKNLIECSRPELRKVRRNIGMIFQHFNLMHSITVYENIAAPLRNGGTITKVQIDQKVKALLKIVDLEDKEKAYPSQLSGGQKQRVAIARALSSDPEILLCDEATSALDPNTTQQILKLLKKINTDMGITIVIITHQMEVVKSICNKVAVMERGKIVECGNMLSVFTDAKTAIAKEFVAQTMHDDTIIEKLQGNTKNLFKMIFLGDATGQPVIAKLMKQSDVLVNILFGNVENICGHMYGNLVVELQGSDAEIADAVVYLTEHGVKVEVLQNAE